MSHGLSLVLEGSTYAGSVAVIRGNALVAERQLENAPKPGRAGREENFLPMVAECLRDAEAAPRDLDRVICGAGPGSFTSLRVAASIAKGIAVGLDRPLFAVSSLVLIVASSRVESGMWLAALPAMRGEVFVSLLEVAPGAIREIDPPRIVAEHSLHAEAARLGATLVGPAIHESETPHARGVAGLIDSILAAGACELVNWEPLYGRLAEAQVKWEAAHGRPLTVRG